MKKILIIGGYGHFGKFIAEALSKEDDIHLIIAGRNPQKAQEMISTFPSAETLYLDIHQNLSGALETVKPDIVIHISGPYQGQDYDVAKACIKHKCHYIDLADAREFVTNIISLDSQAKDAGILICSGASSVPCLTSSIIDHYKNHFTELQEAHYYISTAQKTNMGLATLKSILGYAGKPFKTLINGESKTIYGNLGMDHIGSGRLVGHCDVPDLDIFPKHYPTLKTLSFKAGTELWIVQKMLLCLSWLVRLKVIPSLIPLAPLMLRMSFWFNIFGSTTSHFKMILKGKEHKDIHFDLKAENGDGVYIPCMPSIILTKKLVQNKIKDFGASPCVGYITLDEYLKALSDLDITIKESL